MEHGMVTAFEDTWIECLGDLAQDRVAIKDGNNRDRKMLLQPSLSNSCLGRFGPVAVDEKEIGDPDVLPFVHLILIFIA